ncbi:YbaB/EbfC family nucleoid-associated protein [Nocardia jejuensis]|uniref:YbaB/EbfC family nucleoid-associated protein n=1 Tax=Nocardia jejuensis TaxID=328049 RepID=UPI00082DE38E|nr:YbaB/EbfC family nucleoid-associated protein [Nocardia jejuensis]
MKNDSDPLQRKTEQLTEALTTARSRAESADGLLRVDACADGELTIHLDDRARVLSAHELSRRLTALAAQALTAARAQARTALADFRADPRISESTARAASAIDQPVREPPRSRPVSS